MSWEFDDKHPKELAFIGRRPHNQGLSISRRPLRRFGEPIQLLHLRPLLHRRRSHFSPRGVVPGDRLQSIVSRLESHWGLNRPAIRGIKGDCYLAACIFPMAK